MSRSTRVVLVSGSDDAERRAAGVATFVRKGGDPQAVVDTVAGRRRVALAFTPVLA